MPHKIYACDEFCSSKKLVCHERVIDNNENAIAVIYQREIIFTKGGFF